MVASRHTKRLFQRFAIAAGVAGALLLGIAVAPAAQATDGLGGSIERWEVIARAQKWVDWNVQYSQSGTAYDAERRHTYRRDCSGFVSMTWHITPTGMSAPTTSTLPNYSYRISKSQLQRGDILDRPGSHVVLFHKWANTAHTRMWIYEQSNPTSDMNHRVVYLSSYGAYTAYKYRYIRGR